MTNSDDGNMRKFDGGGTRDTGQNKLDFEGFFSPEVLERRAQYMHKHRLQSDGTLRDSDNWQNLFGEDHFKVCMKSGARHYNDLWKLHRSLPAFDEKGNAVDIEDAICALMFNAEAYLLKILKDKREIAMNKKKEEKEMSGPTTLKHYLQALGLDDDSICYYKSKRQ